MKSFAILFFSSFLFVALAPIKSVAQSVGINNNTPHTSAVLDAQSTDKGLLIPRMSTAQRNAIAGAAAGLLVFDLDKSTIYLYDGQKWQAMLFTNSDAANPPISRSVSDGLAGDKLGISAGISGDYAIVGAYQDDIGTKTDQGSAYIFVRENGLWTEQAKLTASDGGAGNNFGISVSISGDYAVVGSPKASDVWALQGAAYIFARTGTNWVQQAKLAAADGIIGDYFGTSVSIDNDYVIAGAPNARVVYANQGAAYVFVRSGSTWAEQGKLTYSGGKFNDYFGNSVSISGDYAIAGAPYFDWFSANQGAAFIFLKTGSTWTWQERLTANDGAADDFFGLSVSIDGDYAAIGAPYDDGSFTDQGAAYIFLRNGTTWGQQTKINATNNQLNAYFGNSVNINGSYAIVGVPNESANNFQGGVTHIYKRSATTSWDLIRTVKDGSGQAFGFFGSAVGVSGFNYIIGALGKNNSKGEVSFLNIE
jgi:FG-GAP repeat